MADGDHDEPRVVVNDDGIKPPVDLLPPAHRPHTPRRPRRSTGGAGTGGFWRIPLAELLWGLCQRGIVIDTVPRCCTSWSTRRSGWTLLAGVTARS